MKNLSDKEIAQLIAELVSLQAKYLGSELEEYFAQQSDQAWAVMIERHGTDKAIAILS